MTRIANYLLLLPVAAAAAACQPVQTVAYDPYWSAQPVNIVPVNHYRRTTMNVPVIIDSQGRVVAAGRSAENFDARVLPTRHYEDRAFVESRYQPVIGTANNTLVLEGDSRRVRYLNEPW